jgi:hypothetical protein
LMLYLQCQQYRWCHFACSLYLHILFLHVRWEIDGNCLAWIMQWIFWIFYGLIERWWVAKEVRHKLINSNHKSSTLQT